jgi:hypothetical protein
MFNIKCNKHGFKVEINDGPKDLTKKFESKFKKLVKKYGKISAHNIAAAYILSSGLREDYNDHFYVYFEDMDFFKDLIHDMKEH